MTPEQLEERTVFVTTLAKAGWQSNNINENFEQGRWLPYEATLVFQGAKAELRADLHIGDRILILFVYGARSARLELDFMYEGRLSPLLEALVSVQDEILPRTSPASIDKLLDACPECFTYTANGEKRKVVKARAGDTA